MSELRKWGEKDYQEARDVAIKAHGDQTYGDIYPYSKHLDDVVAVLVSHGFSGRFVVAGYLHDTMEDAGLSYNKIKRAFGIIVAEMVFCVTDELGRTREEKKRKTLPKTAGNKSAIILKLADRIANVSQGGKNDMYVKEYPDFKEALFNEDHTDALPLWRELETILGIK